jgi:putative ABC transport system substrate-binding protein
MANGEFRIGSTALFILALALVLLAVPLAVEAQQPGKVYRIGALGGIPPTSPIFDRDWRGAFREGMRELGYIEGQHYVLEYRWTAKPPQEAPALAAELLSLKPDLILAAADVRARPFAQATRTIPIVITDAYDPVGEGLVASLARPGGNVTGLMFSASPEIAGKHLEMLKEAVPKLSRVAVLYGPGLTYPQETLRAAWALGLRLQFYGYRDPQELGDAFAAMPIARAQALFVPISPLNFTQARRIPEFAAKSRLPAVYGFQEPVEFGGLIAYAANAPALFRRAAMYVDKIFKGANPGDLPIEQPTKFELFINLKTAKALGLTIPQSLLIRADKVIQ